MMNSLVQTQVTQPRHRQSVLENKWLKEAAPFMRKYLQIQNIISGTIKQLKMSTIPKAWNANLGTQLK